YTAAWSSFMGTGSAPLRVHMPVLNSVSVDIGIPGGHVSAASTAVITLTNTSENDVAGTLRLLLPWSATSQLYALPVRASAVSTTAISSAGALAAGTYTATAQALFADDVIGDGSAPFAVDPPAWSVTPPNNVIVTAGTTATLSFVVRNDGELAGNAQLN